MKVNFDKSIIRLYFLLISSMLTKFLEGLLLVLTHGVAFWGAKMYLEKAYSGEWGMGIQFGSGLNLGYLHLINPWSLHRLFLSLPKLRSVFSLILLLITKILVWCILTQDIDTIQSITLCQRPMEDTLIWTFTESGCYTMKSGYRFLFQD